MTRLRDLTGQRFGRLLVLRRGLNAASGRVRWWCRCTCGATTLVYGNDLVCQKTQSCGCWGRQCNGERSWKHGFASPRFGEKYALYKAWLGMIQRCENPKTNDYALYGGRGITVCPRWRRSFPNFLADMGPKPSPTHSLDRIDSNGPYQPGNCRWATPSEQHKNCRMTPKRLAATLANAHKARQALATMLSGGDVLD